jgi:hypothetical protein
MTSEGLGETLEIDFADTLAEKKCWNPRTSFQNQSEILFSLRGILWDVQDISPEIALI